MSRLMLDTLYVLEPGAVVRLQNDAALVEDNDLPQPVRVPMDQFGSVVIGGGAQATQPFLLKCADGAVPVSFVTEDGRLRARIVGAEDPSVVLRIAQFQAYEDGERRLAFAKDFLQGKLRNGAKALERAAQRAGPDESFALRQASQELLGAIAKAAEAESVDQLNGIEGAAADVYFAVFPLRLKSRTDFQWNGRTKHPPKDPLNAMLSYVSAVWTACCDSALRVAGLEPDLGFSHEIRPGRPSLACDLVEEFRAPFIDPEVFSGVNKGLFKPEDFETSGSSVRMSPEARKRLVAAIETRRKACVRVPGLSEPVPVGYLPFLQARKLADAIRHGVSYEPYRMP